MDGDIAFTVGENGTATRVFQADTLRVEYLRHPLTLVRAGLAPSPLTISAHPGLPVSQVVVR